MSTNSECLFTEVEPGKWFYVLEDSRGDDEEERSWSWLEEATAYGPFASFDAAYQHLGDNHANPGGYNSEEWHDGKAAPHGKLKELIDAATSPSRSSGYGRW